MSEHNSFSIIEIEEQRNFNEKTSVDHQTKLANECESAKCIKHPTNVHNSKCIACSAKLREANTGSRDSHDRLKLEDYLSCRRGLISKVKQVLDSIEEAKLSFDAVGTIALNLSNTSTNAVESVNKTLNNIIELVESIRINLVTSILREAQTKLTETASVRERRRYSANYLKRILFNKHATRLLDTGDSNSHKICHMAHINVNLFNLKVVNGRAEQSMKLESIRKITVELETIESALSKLHTSMTSTQFREKNMRLMVISGSRNSTKTSLFEIGRKTWSTGAAISKQRFFAAAATLNATVVVSGGMLSDEMRATDSVEVYDPQCNSWSALSNLQNARYGHALINVDGSLYAIGGIDQAEPLSSAERYDAASNTWQQAFVLQTARARLASSFLRGKIIVTGGSPNENEALLSCEACQCYGQSEFMASLNFRRVNHASVAHVDTVYVFGGRDSLSDNFDDVAAVEQYDWHAEKWTVLHCLSLPRVDLAAACLNGCIYLVGGRSDIEGESYNLVERFDEQSKQTLLVDSLAEPQNVKAVACLHLVGSDNKKSLATGRKLHQPKQTKLERNQLDRSFRKTKKQLLFCVGGINNSGAVADAAVCGTDNDSWHFIPQTDTKRHHTAAVRWNNTVVVVGGLTDAGVTGSVEQFDPNSGKWQALPNLVIARRGQALANVDGTLFVFGGNDGKDWLSSVERFYPQVPAWKSETSLCLQREYLAAAGCKKGVVVSGGFIYYHAENSCELYRASDNCSTPIAPLNIGRYSHATATYKDLVYVFGGYGLPGYLAEVEQYDADANTWTLLKCKLSLARSELAAALVGNKIYVVGGRKGDSLGPDEVASSIDIFLPSKKQFQSTMQLPQERYDHGVACISVTNDQYKLILSEANA